MQIDNIVIIIVVVSCLALFGLVAIFSALFLRKLGNNKDYKIQEKEDLQETEKLSPVPLNESQMAYTTRSVQPASRGDSLGYPHNVEGEEVVPLFDEDSASEDMDESEEPEESEEPGVTPTLTVLLRYDRQRSYLLLKVLNMFDLPKRRDKTEVNSFLEIRALPYFGQNPIQTDVYPSSSNPKLEETFEFEVEREELRTQKIEFVIMDAREYSNRSIGFAELNIDRLNVADLMAEREVNTALTIDKPKMQKSLSELSLSGSALDSGDEMQSTISLTEGLNIVEDPDNQSQIRRTKATVRLVKDWEYVAGMETMILLSLYYDKEGKKLIFGIIKVANLKILSNNKKPDPYVKVHISIRNKLKLKRKTAVMKQELNPVYNQNLELPIQEKDLEHVKLVVAIKNNVPRRGGSRRGKTNSLYEVIFGESSTGSFLEHWKAGIASSAKPVAKWHVLPSS